jgi:hypothetical protein
VTVWRHRKEVIWNLVPSVHLFLFTCGLLNDAVSISDYTASSDRMIGEQ